MTKTRRRARALFRRANVARRCGETTNARRLALAGKALLRKVSE